MDSIPDKEQSKIAYSEFMKDAVGSFAPGRIEFLGNHLDYNGGIVLGTAINAGIYGLALPNKDSSFRLFSESFEGAEILGSIEKIEKQTGKRKKERNSKNNIVTKPPRIFTATIVKSNSPNLDSAAASLCDFPSKSRSFATFDF